MSRASAPPRPAGRRRFATTVSAALLAAVLGGCSSAPSLDEPTPPSTPGPTISTDAAHSPESGHDEAPPTAVFIGDSIVRGWGLEPAEAWPWLLGAETGWTVIDLGCDGAGFVATGCGTTVRERIDEAAGYDPDIVFVGASRNDLNRDPAAVDAEIPAAVSALVNSIPRATLVGVASVWGPQPAPPRMGEMDAAVQGAVSSYGGVFLAYSDPLAGGVDIMQPDGIHPTNAGQRAIAETVLSALASSGAEPAEPPVEDEHDH